MIFNIAFITEPPYAADVLTAIRTLFIPTVSNIADIRLLKVAEAQNVAISVNDPLNISLQLSFRSDDALSAFRENKLPGLLSAFHNEAGDRCITFTTLLEPLPLT